MSHQSLHIEREKEKRQRNIGRLIAWEESIIFYPLYKLMKFSERTEVEDLRARLRKAEQTRKRKVNRYSK